MAETQPQENDQTPCPHYAAKLRRRVFTWFNYTDEDIDYLMKIPKEKADYVCFGFEVTTEGKKHLQGYVEFGTPISGSATLGRLKPGIKPKENPGIRVAKLINPAREAQLTYCSKVESTDEEAVAKWGKKFFEIAHKVKAQGERTDWHAVDDMVLDGKDLVEIRSAYPEIGYRCQSAIREAIIGVKAKAARERSGARFDGEFTLRPWQEKLYKMLQGPVSDRKVIWVYDDVGNSGKTWFGLWYRRKFGPENVFYTHNGRAENMALKYEYEQTVMVNLTRKNEGYVCYNILEQFKDGFVSSDKYMSMDKEPGPCHVVIFANMMPDFNAMSKDRWLIIRTGGDETPEDIDTPSEEGTDLPMEDWHTQREINSLAEIAKRHATPGKIEDCAHSQFGPASQVPHPEPQRPEALGSLDVHQPEASDVPSCNNALTEQPLLGLRTVPTAEGMTPAIGSIPWKRRENAKKQQKLVNTRALPVRKSFANVAAEGQSLSDSDS